MYDKTDSTYSLSDDTPHVSNQDERPPPSDRGLLGLVLITRYLQIPATPDGLHLQFALAVKELDRLAIFGDQEIQLSPKSLGFRVRAARVDLNNLNNAILPALCKNTYGEYFILVQIVDVHDGLIPKEANADNTLKNLQYLVHILSGMSGQRKLSVTKLSGFWDGEAILMSPRRSPFFGLHREFNLKCKSAGEIYWLITSRQASKPRIWARLADRRPASFRRLSCCWLFSLAPIRSWKATSPWGN